MKLSDKIRDYITAAFTGLWVQTLEPADALREISDYCTELEYRLAIWDCDRGLVRPLELEQGDDPENPNPPKYTAMDPFKALGQLPRMVTGSADIDEAGILVMQNLHMFLEGSSEGKKKLVQALQNTLFDGRQLRTFVIVLAPTVDIPVELEDWFTVVEHDLPDRDELKKIMEGVTEKDERPKTKADLETVLDAAAGFTRTKAEEAFGLCIARTGRLSDHKKRKIDHQIIIDLKADALRKFGMLEMLRDPSAKFETLGGLAGVKDFCLRALKKRTDKKLNARGICALGVSGAGKSQFCKALGNATDRPVLAMSMGAVKSKYVGESSAHMRRALQIADHMAPCILYLDEIEKMLASLTSEGSPVGGDMLQGFLTWLNDHTSDVFTVCTANNIQSISRTHPEFFRDERWDGVFFFELPNEDAKKEIWKIYMEYYGLEAKKTPPDNLWTGAEIKSCCRKAAMLDITLAEAANLIVPVATTAAEGIDATRTWANGRVLSADHVGEIYSIDREAPKPSGNKRRAVSKPAR